MKTFPPLPVRVTIYGFRSFASLTATALKNLFSRCAPPPLISTITFGRRVATRYSQCVIRARPGNGLRHRGYLQREKTLREPLSPLTDRAVYGQSGRSSAPAISTYTHELSAKVSGDRKSGSLRM